METMDKLLLNIVKIRFWNGGNGVFIFQIETIDAQFNFMIESKGVATVGH
jgi:hypothetical protein